MATIESQGTTIEIGSMTDSPGAFDTIGQVVSINGLGGGQAAVIDTTNLSSTRREKIMGLADEGQLTIEVQYDPDDVGQDACETARANRTKMQFLITLNNGSPADTFEFDGYVLAFEKNIGVDQVVTGNITIEITGAVT